MGPMQRMILRQRNRGNSSADGGSGDGVSSRDLRPTEKQPATHRYPRRPAQSRNVAIPEVARPPAVRPPAQAVFKFPGLNPTTAQGGPPTFPLMQLGTGASEEVRMSSKVLYEPRRYNCDLRSMMCTLTLKAMGGSLGGLDEVRRLRICCIDLPPLT